MRRISLSSSSFGSTNKNMLQKKFEQARLVKILRSYGEKTPLDLKIIASTLNSVLRASNYAVMGSIKENIRYYIRATYVVFP